MKNSHMQKNTRIIVLYNALTGKLKMCVPNSLLVKWGLFILLTCCGISLLMHQLPPIIHAIAPNGFFH
jgi:hypothetical protein